MSAEVFRFGDFELDRGAFQLRRAGHILRLERIPLELLFLLVENGGRLVTREEILERIWGKSVFVDPDNAINTAVRKIRQALNDDPATPRFLHTIPAKGYRFDGSIAPPRKPDSSPARSAVPRKLMLVVLPFVNMNDDPHEDYFADGLTEEMITHLGSLDPLHLGVIARTSAMKYKRTQADVAQISRELNANFVLEGSVRRDGNRIRVSAQLIQSSDQSHLWAGNFDRDLTGILQLQSDLARAIAAKIQLTLSQQTQARLAAASTVNADAQEAYLLGLQAWNLRTQEGFKRAIPLFSRAVSIDPDYALAHSGLARTCMVAPIFGVSSPLVALPKAREAATRALRLDPLLAEAHTVLAFVQVHFDFDWPGAEREFVRAIELNPSDPMSHFFYSNSYLSPLGRHDEAIAEMKRSLGLDPYSLPLQSFLGRTYVWARRFDEAEAQFHAAIRLAPHFALNHQRLARLYALQGKYAEAIAEDTQARLLAGHDPKTTVADAEELHRAYLADGPRGYWLRVLEFSEEKESQPEGYSSAFGSAIVLAKLGQKEKALDALEQAYEERAIFLTELPNESAFDDLRSTPRFAALLQRVHLASHFAAQ